MAFPAFLDACTLFGIRLTDLLLRLADEGAFRALWSDDVLEEVRRNVIRSRVDAAAVRGQSLPSSEGAAPAAGGTSRRGLSARMCL
jgi:hypothetical protein